MQNTLYYTFSTISQTLAGALGLVGAFLLYYLIQIDQRLRHHLYHLYSQYPASTETVPLDFLWERFDVANLLIYFENDHLRVFEAGEAIDKHLHLKPATHLWQKRQNALSTARSALVSTSIVVLFSLSMLASTHLWAGIAALSTLFLVASVLGAAWCVTLYAKLVLEATRL